MAQAGSTDLDEQQRVNCRRRESCPRRMPLRVKSLEFHKSYAKSDSVVGDRSLLRRCGLGVLVPPSSNNIQIISTIFSGMAVLKRGFQTSLPSKGNLQPILKVGITTVFVLSLSYFTRDQTQTDQKPLTDTNNGQTRSISLPQTGEKDT